MLSCFQGCSTSFDWITYVHLCKELPFGRALLSDKVECAWDKNATWVIRSPVGLLQITPSPSSPPQLCFVVWEHCWREASLPLHFISSIAKSSETRPKWEFVVIIPPRKPSILEKKDFSRRLSVEASWHKLALLGSWHHCCYEWNNWRGKIHVKVIWTEK